MRVITLLFLLLLVCSVSKAEPHKLSVGVMLPLSGPLQDYGISMQSSMELAVKDNPSSFSNIRFVFEDVQNDPKQGVASFQKLISVDKVDIAYVFGVAHCKALAPMAERYRIPLVGQCIDQWSSRGREYVLRFMNYTDEYLKVQVDWLQRKGLKDIGVVLSEHPYTEEMLAALQRHIEPEQSIHIVDSYSLSATDFRTSALKIKNSSFDVIGVFLYAGQISQFYRQMREQGIKLPTFGTNLFESRSELELGGGSLDGAVFANNSVKHDFQLRYESEFPMNSQVGFGALAYEFTILVGKLFNITSRPINSQLIINRFKSVKKTAGLAAGPYWPVVSEVAGNYFYFPIKIKKIERTRVVTVNDW